MRILGNIIWFFMAGWILAILTYLSGLILTILVVTAPVGLGLMEYGKFLFLPFTHDMVRKKKGSVIDAVHMTYQTYANIVKVIYIIVFGIWLFIASEAIRSAYHRHRSSCFARSIDWATEIIGY